MDNETCLLFQQQDMYTCSARRHVFLLNKTFPGVEEEDDDEEEGEEEDVDEEQEAECMSSCSTRGHVFLLDKKHMHVFLLNKRTCPLVQQEDTSSC